MYSNGPSPLKRAAELALISKRFGIPGSDKAAIIVLAEWTEADGGNGCFLFELPVGVLFQKKKN